MTDSYLLADHGSEAVIKAMNVPVSKTQKSYVSIKLGSGEPQATKEVKGINPSWNETFML
jgi:hypothetical protein